MRSSAISSATGISPPTAGPLPRSFALTGRSRPLDPRIQAVRPDIADVRLAEFVFAPHYAEPLGCMLVHATTLRATRQTDGETIASLAVGEAFELLEVTRGVAWGIAVVPGLVGYVDADALVVDAA